MEKVVVNLDGCSQEEAQKAIREAMLALFSPTFEQYERDGDMGRLCTDLVCETPREPTRETPSVLEQLKAAFGESRSS